MKKSGLILLICFGIFFTTNAQQNKISSSLAKLLNDKDNVGKYFRVNIFLKETANLDSLNYMMKKQKLPSKLRAKMVLNFLTQKAAESQRAIIQSVNQYEGASAINIQPLWIVNMMIIETKAELIQKLSERDDIELIDIDNSKIFTPIEQPVNKSASIANGKEPGLAAINAPALWAMGYTGRGRIACSIDTGIWPNHPAIKNNFLGNYLPLSQSWYGYHSEIPYDKTGSHGTHTVGTEMGLDRATNDTIGVAFNAFVIATDPVAKSITEVKPLSDFLLAFQWVFNPDGDTATTSDIPDVINNSWGYSVPTDTLLCSGFIAQMFYALETAGIACVFSAGNEGPGTQTIPFPQHVTINELNSYTVGAVDGNTAGFPIASFSSRGPTNCNVDSVLKIKPEVSAPGVNVRSAVNQNEYASLSGTSMAAPHVTGAVLLLKEAFPDVPGFDILAALYYTASDLGVAGEDNIYGRGMINVLAAYNYLAQTYTAVPPLARKYDIAISNINNLNSVFYCNNTFSPQITIANLGDSNLYSAKIYYRLNNEPIQFQNWTGILQKNQTAIVQLNPITALSQGKYELTVKIANDSNVVEYNVFNNNSVARFDIRNEVNLPYYQDFENGSLKDNELIVLNPDYSTTWDTITTAGLPNSFRSVGIKLSNYNPLASQKDNIITPVLNIPDSANITMQFNLAYHYSGLADTLKINATDDCGNTYAFNLYKKQGSLLNTTSSSSSFVPALPSDWRLETVDISALRNKKLIFNIESVNRHGSNLFLDNLHIYADNNLFISDIANNLKLKVYPNPANDIITVDFKENFSQQIKIEILDVLGKRLFHAELPNQKEGRFNIDINNFESGIYFVKYSNNSISRFVKVLKK